MAGAGIAVSTGLKVPSYGRGNGPGYNNLSEQSAPFRRAQGPELAEGLSAVNLAPGKRSGRTPDNIKKRRPALIMTNGTLISSDCVAESSVRVADLIDAIAVVGRNPDAVSVKTAPHGPPAKGEGGSAGASFRREAIA